MLDGDLEDLDKFDDCRQQGELPDYGDGNDERSDSSMAEGISAV